MNNILYIEFAEILKAGISEGTVKAARFRKSFGWNFITDPNDRRKILIAFETLKERYKYQITQNFGDPYQYVTAQHLLPKLPPVSTQSNQIINNYIIPGSELSLPETEIRNIRRAIQFIELLIKYDKKAAVTKLGYPSVANFYNSVRLLIKNEGIKLPASYTKLKAKIRNYKLNGPTSLISKKYGKSNNQKRTPEINDWLIAMYAQPVPKIDVTRLTQIYTVKAKQEGWANLSESGIYNFLHQPDVKPIWFLGRHGHGAWKREFEHHTKLLLPTFRDALWCSDGTKLDFYYLDENKMSAKLKIYIVTDVFSECILGYDLALTEDQISIYSAAKMALNQAQHKPHQWLYDGQSGHKAMKSFFDGAVSGCHFAAKPYNAQSKPIEGLLNRLQKQLLANYWFCSKQTIKAKRLDNQPNMEFILSNKNKLPTLNQVQNLIPGIINNWNEGLHPAYKKPRLKLYNNSVNPEPVKLSLWDSVDMFWITTKRTITYRKHGIDIVLGGIKYQFEVHNQDGSISETFRENNIGTKFKIKYDPEDLSSIQLYIIDYNGNLRYQATATTKQAVPRAIIDYDENSANRIAAIMDLRQRDVMARKMKLQNHRDRAGIDEEDVLKISYLNPDKEEMNNSEGIYQIAEAEGIINSPFSSKEISDYSRFKRKNN